MIRALKTTADPPTTFDAQRRRRRSRMRREARPRTDVWQAGFVFTRRDRGPIARLGCRPSDRLLSAARGRPRRCVIVRGEPLRPQASQRGGRDPPRGRVSLTRRLTAPGPPRYGGTRRAPTGAAGRSTSMDARRPGRLPRRERRCRTVRSTRCCAAMTCRRFAVERVRHAARRAALGSTCPRRPAVFALGAAARQKLPGKTSLTGN
jgi:hypothetical protein